MPIDPSIALQSHPPSSEGMMNAMQAGMQMKLYKNKLAAAEAEQSRMGALRNYMRTHNMTTPEGRAGVNQFDPTGEAYKNLESAYASSQSGGKTEDERAAANYNEVRNTVTGLLFMKDASGQRVPPTKEMVGQQLAMAKQRGLIRPEVADTMLATMPDDPNQIEVRLSRFLAEGLTPEQKNTMYNPKLEMADLGGTKQPYNPYTSAAVGPGMAVSLSPNEQSMAADRAAGRQYQQDTLKETGRHNRNQENLAREQYQSSIDPETQRRLAEAKKKGEEAAGKGPAATSAAAAQAFLTSAGYDPETGADAVSKLIPKSTGGLLQTAGAKAAGALNITTSGQEAIGQLASRSSKLVLDLLGGKLGAGVSNADREFMLQAVGDIGNSFLPTGVRLAAWNDLMSRMKTAAGGASAAAPAAAGPRKTKSGVTFTVEE